MSEEWKTYVNDARTACKYGAKCYQKNTDHHSQYKHPPNNYKDYGNRQKKYKLKRYSPYDITKKTQQVCNDNTTKDDKNADNQIKSAQEEVLTLKQEILIPKNLSFINPDDKMYTIKDLFLVEMPFDFYKLYLALSTNNESIEKTLAGVGLQLIGPYEFLLGKLPKLDKELYLLHWKFFYDPPEFQAVIKVKGRSQFHFGYFRDDPNDMPVFVGSNDSAKGYSITPVAGNIFGALYQYLQNEKNHTPFTAVACKSLAERLKQVAEENGFCLEKFDIKKRQSQIVTKTLHGAGISVPFDKKTQLGYRKLVENDASLKKMFSKLKNTTDSNEKDAILSELQPVITYANIAVDECDFGTGLEIGIDLFCSGLKELEQSALSCLCSAYNLLNRNAFSAIIQAHLKCRRRGSDMSVLSLCKK